MFFSTVDLVHFLLLPRGWERVESKNEGRREGEGLAKAVELSRMKRNMPSDNAPL